MRFLWTVQYVQPIPLREFASAFLVVGTFIAAQDFGAHFSFSPLNLAIALSMLLRIFMNLLFLPAKRAALLRGDSFASWAFVGALCVALVLALLVVSETVAIKIWCANYAFLGLFSLWSAKDKDIFSKEAAALDMSESKMVVWHLFQAFYIAVLVLTVFSAYTLSGDFAAVLCFTFGLLAMQFLVRWAFMLYCWSRDDAL